jgi:hypothetical protein
VPEVVVYVRGGSRGGAPVPDRGGGGVRPLVLHLPIGGHHLQALLSRVRLAVVLGGYKFGYCRLPHRGRPRHRG